LAWNWGR